MDRLPHFIWLDVLDLKPGPPALSYRKRHVKPSPGMSAVDVINAKFGLHLSNGYDLLLWAVKRKHPLATCRWIREWEWSGDVPLVANPSVTPQDAQVMKIYQPYALKVAASEGYLEVIQLFRDWGLTSQDVCKRECMELGCDGVFFVAARAGHLRLCQFLVDWLQCDFPPAKIALVLTGAACMGHLAICQLLQSHMPTVHTGRALKDAAHGGHLEVCRLLRHRMTPQQVHDSGTMHSAARAGKFDVCMWLHEWAESERLIGVTSPLCLDFTVLLFVVKHGNLAMCRYLKGLKAVPTFAEQNWASRVRRKIERPLFTLQEVRGNDNELMRQATWEGHLHILQFFREWDDDGDRLTLADVRCDGNKMLWLAAYFGHLHILKFLKKWRDPGSSDQLTLRDVRALDNRAFRWAAKRGHLHVLIFFKKWLDPNDRLTIRDVRAKNNSAIRGASKHGHLHVLQFLKDWVDEGTLPTQLARLTVADLRSKKRAALRRAAENGHLDVVQFLMSWVDPDTQDRLTLNDVRAVENYAFRHASRFGHVHVLKYLISLGLGLQDVRTMNNTALQLAAFKGHTHVLKLFKTLGLTLEDVRSDNNYALRWAAKNGRVHVLQVLRNWRDAGRALTFQDVCVDNGVALRDARFGKHWRTHDFLLDWIRELTIQVDIPNKSS